MLRGHGMLQLMFWVWVFTSNKTGIFMSFWRWDMEVSWGFHSHGGTPKWSKWTVYNGTSYINGWYGGTPIHGNPHTFTMLRYWSLTPCNGQSWIPCSKSPVVSWRPLDVASWEPMGLSLRSMAANSHLSSKPVPSGLFVAMCCVVFVLTIDHFLINFVGCWLSLYPLSTFLSQLNLYYWFLASNPLT